MNSTAGTVLEFTVLKSQPKADEALTLLRKIHSLVKPIMKKHGWTLPKLVEFFPKQSNLLGLNYNRGEKICLRLRPANRPTSFYPLEDLIGTMLHELTHNVHGPHDSKFFTFLDGLNKEFDTLLSTGWSGEGFYGRGERVGVGGSHDVSMGAARELALKKAEERMRLGKLMGKGGRLGGDVGFTRGKTRGEILAEAAERRAQANKVCGADHSGDHHLPPAIQAEIDQAEADGIAHVVDLTLDSDGEDEDVSRVVGDLAPPKVKQVSDPNPSSDGIEILSVAGPSKRQHSPPPNAAPAKKTRSSSSTPSTTSPQAPGSSSRPASPARTSSSVSLPPSLTSDSWTCPTCTYDNPLPFLSCEMCATERPRINKPTMLFRPHRVAREAGAPDPSILELDEGWICGTCTTMNQHAFWTCTSCGTVKKSSTRS